MPNHNYMGTGYKPTREWLIENGFESSKGSEYNGVMLYQYHNGPLYYHTIDEIFKIYTDSGEGFKTVNLKSAVEVSNFIYHISPFIQD